MDLFCIFLSSLSKFPRSRTIRNSFLLMMFCFNTTSLFSKNAETSEDSCQLILLHESQKPLELRKAVIYFSTSRFLIRKDSLCFTFSSKNSDIDTIFFTEQWNY